MLGTKWVVLLLMMMMIMMIVNFTETKIIWGKRTSIDKMLPSNWLTGKSCGIFWIND